MSLGTLPPPMTKMGDMEESMLLIKEALGVVQDSLEPLVVWVGHATPYWCQWGRGWGGGVGLGGLKHWHEDGNGDGGWECSRTLAISFRRSSICAHRVTISAKHEMCCLGGGNKAAFLVGALGWGMGALASGLVGWSCHNHEVASAHWYAAACCFGRHRSGEGQPCHPQQGQTC